MRVIHYLTAAGEIERFDADGQAGTRDFATALSDLGGCRLWRHGARFVAVRSHFPAVEVPRVVALALLGATFPFQECGGGGYRRDGGLV